MLTHALNLYSSSQQSKDRDWIYLVLEFLKAYVEDLGKELLVEADDHRAYISGLIAAFKDAAANLQSGLLLLSAHSHQVFIVSQMSIIRIIQRHH